MELSFPHAYAMRGCTQEDAPALEIYLTQAPLVEGHDPPPPYIRFEISSRGSETLPASSFELRPLRRDLTKKGRIVRGEWSQPGEVPVWLSGKLTIDGVTPGQQVSGQYVLKLPDGRHLQNSFVAGFVARTATCG